MLVVFRALSVAVVFACLITASLGQEIASQELALGVSWRTEFTTSGPLNHNILRVNIADPRVKIEAESAHDRLFAGETVLSSVRREAASNGEQIIAGVNADFWSNSPRMFSPVGLLVADGMIYNMPAKKRSAFVLTKDETPYIGVVTLKVELSGKSGRFSIDRINSGTRSTTEVVLFTPPYGNEVAPAKGKRYTLAPVTTTEFLPNQPIEVRIREVDADTSTPLSRDTLVLHIPQSKLIKAKALRDGTVYKLAAIMPEVKGVVASVCGGGPTLVQNGKTMVKDEGNGVEFSKTQHPRTAVGFTKDKKTVVFVTVDGRQPKLSMGASLQDLADYMGQQGCWQAMNLDGGGSTTMIVKDKVVNKPSDLKGPRTVANSLLIVVE